MVVNPYRDIESNSKPKVDPLVSRGCCGLLSNQVKIALLLICLTIFSFAAHYLHLDNFMNESDTKVPPPKLRGQTQPRIPAWRKAELHSEHTPEPDFNNENLKTIETISPTHSPTYSPTHQPTFQPTFQPTYEPTYEPTFAPTFVPTYQPTLPPTTEPTAQPTIQPTLLPTLLPTQISTKGTVPLQEIAIQENIGAIIPSKATDNTIVKLTVPQNDLEEGQSALERPKIDNEELSDHNKNSKEALKELFGENLPVEPGPPVLPVEPGESHESPEDKMIEVQDVQEMIEKSQKLPRPRTSFDIPQNNLDKIKIGKQALAPPALKRMIDNQINKDENNLSEVTSTKEKSKINYCERQEDPFEKVPVENFVPPKSAPFETVLEWKTAVKDMIKSISKIQVGGDSLRSTMEKEVNRMKVLRFTLFCKYVE